jgi:hypothetical protein
VGCASARAPRRFQAGLTASLPIPVISTLCFTVSRRGRLLRLAVQSCHVCDPPSSSHQRLTSTHHASKVPSACLQTAPLGTWIYCTGGQGSRFCLSTSLRDFTRVIPRNTRDALTTLGTSERATVSPRRRGMHCRLVTRPVAHLASTSTMLEAWYTLLQEGRNALSAVMKREGAVVQGALNLQPRIQHSGLSFSILARSFRRI